MTQTTSGVLSMPVATADAPMLMPVLSRGKHRNPRKGACFMEFASYLAGERWSDHPACTHALLASAARMVNDCTSDDYRPNLAALIPSVIGLTSDDPRVDVHIALRAAVEALPVAPMQRQRVLAVAIIAGRRVLVELDGAIPADLMADTEAALDAAPDATRWAYEFAGSETTDSKNYLKYGCPTAIRCAVEGIAKAAVTDPDQRLHRLLTAVIDEADTVIGAELDGVGVDAWSDACRVTGTAGPAAT